MRYYLDTNICVYYLKGMFPPLRERLLSFDPDAIVVPAITKAELLYGAEKSKRREENLSKIHDFLLPFHIQGFTNSETQTYAIVRSRLEKAGTPVGPNDLIIASIVISNSGMLVTHNVQEFSRINGLSIEDWTI